MLNVLLTAAVSFIISFLAIPVVLQIADQKKLFDVPDERKVHTHPVASLGGVGIFGGFLLASLLSIQGHINPEFQYFFAAAGNRINGIPGPALFNITCTPNCTPQFRSGSLDGFFTGRTGQGAGMMYNMNGIAGAVALARRGG